MEYRCLLILFFIVPFQKCIAQTVDTANDIVYEPVKEDYFKPYKHAKLIADYYFTDGYSTSERYAYEIILIDSLVMVQFSAPESDSYRYVEYDKRTLLANKDIGRLKLLLRKAGLKQVRKGIPRATFTAYTKEVLILRSKNINIAGGMAYGNGASYPDSMRAEIVVKEIAEDRKQSSSIGGDYDTVILFLKKLFVDLARLEKQAIKQ